MASSKRGVAWREQARAEGGGGVALRFPPRVGSQPQRTRRQPYCHVFACTGLVLVSSSAAAREHTGLVLLMRSACLTRAQAPLACFKLWPVLRIACFNLNTCWLLRQSVVLSTPGAYASASASASCVVGLAQPGAPSRSPICAIPTCPKCQKMEVRDAIRRACRRTARVSGTSPNNTRIGSCGTGCVTGHNWSGSTPYRAV